MGIIYVRPIVASEHELPAWIDFDYYEGKRFASMAAAYEFAYFARQQPEVSEVSITSYDAALKWHIVRDDHGDGYPWYVYRDESWAIDQHSELASVEGSTYSTWEQARNAVQYGLRLERLEHAVANKKEN